MILQSFETLKALQSQFYKLGNNHSILLLRIEVV
jgi:hypothetical protein